MNALHAMLIATLSRLRSQPMSRPISRRSAKNSNMDEIISDADINNLQKAIRGDAETAGSFHPAPERLQPKTAPSHLKSTMLTHFINAVRISAEK